MHIRMYTIYLPLFSFLRVQCGFFVLLFFSMSPIHIHLSSMAFWYHFILFFLSFHSARFFFFFFLFSFAHLGPLTVINTQEGISLQKGEPNKNNKPKALKAIEMNWMRPLITLFDLFYTHTVFTENLSTSFRFASLCCFGSVKLSRPPQFAYHIYIEPGKSTDQWIYDELQHIITTDNVLKLNG